MNVTTYKKTDLFLKCSDPRRAMTDRVWVFSRNTRAKNNLQYICYEKQTLQRTKFDRTECRGQQIVSVSKMKYRLYLESQIFSIFLLT